MGQPQKDSFNAGKDYRRVLWIAGRQAQDWGLVEEQVIQDVERSRFGDRVFEQGGIQEGVETYLPATNQLGITEGWAWFFGRMMQVPATVLTFPSAGSGIHTAFARVLTDQVTAGEDASLVSPTTGDPVEERIRTRLALVTSSPDAFNERFERFISGVPENWTLATGACQRGYPGKLGESGVQLNHTTGTETRLEATITLTPATAYTVYFWVRTQEGEVDLSLGNGAYVDFERTSPSWSPTDYGFATSQQYVRKSFTVTADANTEAVQLRIVIPSAAPSTKLLIDGILVTTSALGALEIERHHVPLLFWDRATDVVTRAVARSSRLAMRDLQPPLDGRDIINFGASQSLLDFLAGLFSDIFGSFRVPPGMIVSRETTLDDSTHVGVRISRGRAFIAGYPVDAPTTLLALNKALTTAHITAEGATAFFGTQLYPLAKTVGATTFPVAAVTQVVATVELAKTLTKGVAGGIDDTGETNVVTVLGVSQGTQAELTGTGTTFTFSEATNTFKLTTTNYDGTAGAEQTIVFARGTYTLTEVLEALSRGSGRAYRSGKIIGNVLFESDGSGHVRIKTKTRSVESTLTMGGAPSTANAVLGFTNSATDSGTGTTYAESTDWSRVGNSLDWLGAAEPTEGTSYTIVLRRNAVLAVNTDYKVGGTFSSVVTRRYRVAALSTGVGLAGTAVLRSTPIGSMNLLSWPAVANATSYNIYRSDDGGSTYGLLKNVTSTSYVDEGSLTPDTGTGLSTVSGTTTGSTASGASTVVIGADPTTLGFSASGKAYLAGTDEFDYSGVDGTGFTGVTNVGATHDTGATVTAAPAMSTVTIAEGNLGSLNFSPQGLEAVDNTTLTIDYDYYRPRADVLVVNQQGAVSAIAGVPADRPFPPTVPPNHLRLAQALISANSTAVEIQNETGFDRLSMRELQGMSSQLRQARHVQEETIIIQEIENRVSTAKTGRFADSLSTDQQLDQTHPLWDALHYLAYGFVSVPRARAALTLAVNSGATTAVQFGGKWYAPSTESVHSQQLQWSETIGINPYEAFSVAPPELLLQPDHAVWTQQASSESVIEAQLSAISRELATPNAHPYGNISIKINGQAYRNDYEASLYANIRYRQEEISVQKVRETITRALNEQGYPNRIEMEPMVITIRGQHFVADEDNIAATFYGQAVTLTAVSPTTAGTNAGTVRADAAGRFTATFTIPSGSLAGTADVRCAGGGGSIASSPFALTLIDAPQGPTVEVQYVRCPIAQSIYTDHATYVSAVGVWFATKSASIPVEVQLREMIAGVPDGRLLATKTIAPSEITLNVETKVSFNDYVYLPAAKDFAVVLLCAENAYTLQMASLGKYGKNPEAPIAQNPYQQGVLFSSSNGKSWTIHNESDLRFKLYERNFSNAVLEFNPVSSIQVSDLWLGAQQAIPPSTGISWEYELNGTSVVTPFAALQKARLESEATSVILRARITTTDAKVSPSIMAGSFISLVGFLNDTAGTVVWRSITFAEDLTSAKIYAGAQVPNGATITWKASNDDGVTWDTASVDGSVAVDADWTEYELSVTFSDDTKRAFRLRADLTAGSSLRPPLISTVGVVLQ